MRVFCALFGLFLAIAIVNCSPVVKRETEEDLSPLNEVYVLEADEAADGEGGNRDKRKIGIKLGLTNGILNFVFGKLDTVLDTKTRALAALDEAQKAKNAIYGIDPNYSATTAFVSGLASQKLRAATGSIGPIINSATTLISGASTGLTNAIASKIAPLSSIITGLSGGLGGGASAGAGAGAGAGTGGIAGGSGTASGSALVGNLLSSKINTISSLSQSSGGLSGGLGGLSGGLSGGAGGAAPGNDASSGSSPAASGGANAGVGVSLGAFGNLAGEAATITTTTDDTPVFDRTRVSLDIPSRAIGTGFSLVTNVSKILSDVIFNSARRTQTFFEIFKPFFRGAFSIKGLPSDNPK